MQTLQISVPKPCHEDWQKMTAAEQGRFCGACQKTVVDFSTMSDGEIIRLLEQKKGKLCGRFASTQLERPIAPPKIYKTSWFKWVMQLIVPMILFTKSSFGQKKVPKQTAVTSSNMHITMGKMIRVMPKDTIDEPKPMMISATVVDEENNPIVMASVMIDQTKNAVATNAKGFFSIAVPSESKKINLQITAVGFQTLLISVKDLVVQKNKVALKMESKILGEVVVKSYPATVCRTNYSNTMCCVNNPLLFTNLKNQKLTIPPRIISGNVVDQAGNSVAQAYVMVSGTNIAIKANAIGNFSLSIPIDYQNNDLLISAIGYQSKTISLKEIKDNSNDNPFTLIKNDQIGYSLVGIAGGISIVHQKRKNSFIDTVSKLIKINSTTISEIQSSEFTLFPNPIPSGQILNISAKVKKAGVYYLELISTNGELMMAKEVRLATTNEKVELQTSDDWAAGTYFLRILDADKKFVFNSKVVIL